MEYVVYKITYKNQNIYFGYTGNIERRIKDHNSLFRNGHKKNLYDFLRDNNFKGEIVLTPIKTFTKKIDARRFEAYLIFENYFSSKTIKQKLPSLGR